MILVFLLVIFLGLNTMAAASKSITAYDFSFTSIDGNPLPLSSFTGKAVLVVNTASYCGFTSQYSQLQTLWHAYRDRGLIVLGVPSNDFGAQEPGTNNEIKAFCEVNFDIDFPLTEKVHVKGESVHPFYAWAERKLGVFAKPRWNFHKYLIAPDGHLVNWFSSVTSPSSSRLTKAVEAVLP
ncbi:MAG: glutathione peroxidase [Magnetovibrio sp.]|nr:glutathione peroxidase [Magnetovibrio sp.]